MIRQLPVALVAISLTACAGGSTHLRRSVDDPSSPEAPEGALVATPEALVGKAPRLPARETPAPASASEGESHHHHHAPAGTRNPPAVYTCPMHPEVTQGEAGRCPKCKMRLVPHEGVSAREDGS